MKNVLPLVSMLPFGGSLMLCVHNILMREFVRKAKTALLQDGVTILCTRGKSFWEYSIQIYPDVTDAVRNRYTLGDVHLGAQHL